VSGFSICRFRNADSTLAATVPVEKTQILQGGQEARQALKRHPAAAEVPNPGGGGEGLRLAVRV
jgi:hypothetical protein